MEGMVFGNFSIVQGFVGLTVQLSACRSLILYLKNLLDIPRSIFGMVKVDSED